VGLELGLGLNFAVTAVTKHEELFLDV